MRKLAGCFCDFRTNYFSDHVSFAASQQINSFKKLPNVKESASIHMLVMQSFKCQGCTNLLNISLFDEKLELNSHNVLT